MFRATRIAVAAILALAVVALPVVLAQCVESCEAHQRTVASTPACHHAASVGTHISQPVVRQNVVIAERVLLSAGTPGRISTCLH